MHGEDHEDKRDRSARDSLHESELNELLIGVLIQSSSISSQLKSGQEDWN